MRGHVVQVAHRRLDVGVAHPRLDLAEVDAPRRALRTERVPQVVKHDRTAGSYVQLEPVMQTDWKAVFRVPWMSPGK